MIMKHKMPTLTSTQKMALSALCLALGLLLPMLTGGNRPLGKLLCLMHLPVLFCGLVCDWRWGAAVGLICPLLRSFLFGAPVFFPSAAVMSLELTCYGLLAGLCLPPLVAKWGTKPWAVLVGLLPPLVGGRLMMGLANFLLLGSEYSFGIWLAAAFVTPWPGILLQLFVLPCLVSAFWALHSKGAARQKGSGTTAH